MSNKHKNAITNAEAMAAGKSVGAHAAPQLEDSSLKFYHAKLVLPLWHPRYNN